MLAPSPGKLLFWGCQDHLALPDSVCCSPLLRSLLSWCSEAKDLAKVPPAQEEDRLGSEPCVDGPELPAVPAVFSPQPLWWPRQGLLHSPGTPGQQGCHWPPSCSEGHEDPHHGHGLVLVMESGLLSSLWPPEAVGVPSVGRDRGHWGSRAHTSHLRTARAGPTARTQAPGQSRLSTVTRTRLRWDAP